MYSVLLGDIAFNGIISTEPEKNRERYKDIVPILSKASLVFANLETPLKVEDTRNENKNSIYFSLSEPTEQLLKMLNISCVSLANNHIYDCKMPGLKATIYLLDKLGIYHTGAGWLTKHIEPIILQHNRQNIGFLAYVDQGTNPKTEKFPELLINYFTLEKVLSDIKKIKKNVDKLIVSIHWGLDYSNYPTKKQVEIGHRLISEGCNIVMGHHSHTVQPFEQFKNGIIFYSLGGLTYGDEPWRGQMRALRVSTKKSFIPLLSSNFEYINSYRTNELKGNIVKVKKGDFFYWSKKMMKRHCFFEKHPLIKQLIRFKETKLEKVYNFFFGYYRNPFIAINDIVANLIKR